MHRLFSTCCSFEYYVVQHLNMTKTKPVASINIHDTDDDFIHWSSVIDASQISRRKALISTIVTK